MKWPPWNAGDREQRKRIHEEYERRKKQLQDLCRAVKAESVSDLQDILCCMVLSECVYKVTFKFILFLETKLYINCKPPLIERFLLRFSFACGL